MKKRKAIELELLDFSPPSDARLARDRSAYFADVIGGSGEGELAERSESPPPVRKRKRSMSESAVVTNDDEIDREEDDAHMVDDMTIEKVR